MAGRFYGRWVAANGAAEAVGLGTTLALGGLAARALERHPGPGAVLLGALAAVVCGVMLEGVLVGLAQVRVLKRHVAHPYRWLWANALAWALGMLLIFAGMDRVPWSQGLPAIITAVVLVCALAGLAVGAVNGWFLMRMTSASASAS